MVNLGEFEEVVLLAVLRLEDEAYAIPIREEIRRRAHRGVARGALYTALDRLSGEGLVRMVREEIVNGRARRHYDLTPAGRSALEAEAAHLAEAARVVIDRTARVTKRPAAGLA